MNKINMTLSDPCKGLACSRKFVRIKKKMLKKLEKMLILHINVNILGF